MAKDSSGNGNGGTIKGGAKWVDGKFGKALEFNGTDSCVSTDKALLEKVSDFTITLWVKKGKMTANRIGLVGQNDTVEFGFIQPNTVQIWSEGAGTGLNATWTFPEGEWHHVAATGTPKSLKIYFDGKQVAEQSVNVPNHGSSAFKVNIGGCGVFDGTGNFFTGAIDDVGIFHVALEEDDIKTIINDGLGKALGVTPVEPSGKLTVIWATLKSRR